ncbi:helix-turn-helix domain-containing protein [Halobacillus shinanisalinarum]|uniref:Helix-turn-helix domain-containing protein n=1 Tax=Halobacillus shinanisalinarum TaxID=2932258 RepID=A0ABY4H2T4_9BACI|nr:helix-turn-helix domain-containing protein [Halobacillus shinanisalinarum]UOQ94765.1 helix-turn-helix domain-containing protein [Halobacillus shinanisalinarum]
MNYVKEIDAFYDQTEVNPLSHSAIALWFAMMNLNAKTGWTEEFKVGGPALCVKSGLGETTFKRARQELKEKGYIIHKSGKPKEIPTYQMVSLQRKEVN